MIFDGGPLATIVFELPDGDHHRIVQDNPLTWPRADEHLGGLATDREHAIEAFARDGHEILVVEPALEPVVVQG